MVAGLNKFTEHFKDYSDSYIIIGGTACDIIIGNAGFEPRATDDIDIVLVVEALKPAFIRKFWEFIQNGKYITQQIEPEKRNRYRFCDPQSPDFPIQIELFSKLPDTFNTGEEAYLTPIPSDDGLSSLSAILLDKDYYEFTIAHSVLKDGVHFADIDALICLKAFAYLDNKRLKAEGKKIRTRDVVKHKYDVFRMVFLMNSDTNIILPEAIKRNLLLFADDVEKELPDPAIFKGNGFGKQDMATIFDQLLKSFNLSV
jgi:hypothetical protein